MTEITTTGKTVAEAVELACETLGISSSDAVYEIIEEARGGFLGIGAKLAKVHVWLREDEISGISLLEEMARPRSAAPAPQVKVTAPTPQQMRHDDAPRRSEPTPQPARPASPSLKPEIKAFVETAVEEVEIPENGLPDSAKTSLEYLRGMTKRLGAEKIEFKAIKTEKGVCFVLDGDDASLIIGRRGETMDALQYLCTLVSSRTDEDYCKITLDVAGYRKKREKTLQSLAQREAAKVKKTKYSQTLEPMNPYERRIVHSTVQMIEGVKSESTGDEPYRRVVISLESGGKSGSRGRGGDQSGYRGRNDRAGGKRDDSNYRPKKDFADRKAQEQKTAAAPSEKAAKKDGVDAPALYTKIEL